MKHISKYVCLFVSAKADNEARNSLDAKYMAQHGLTKENSVEYDWGIGRDGVTATTEWKKIA